MKQLRLFPDAPCALVEGALVVSVFNYGDYYQAELYNGWWIARGKSPKAAVKKVVKMYEGE